MFFSFNNESSVIIFPATQLHSDSYWGIIFFLTASFIYLLIDRLIDWQCFKGLIEKNQAAISRRLRLPAPILQPNSVNRLTDLDSFQSELNA